MCVGKQEMGQCQGKSWERGCRETSCRNPEGPVAAGQGPLDRSDLPQKDAALVTTTVKQEGSWEEWPLSSRPPVLSVPPIG